MTKVLITGATGNVGIELIRALHNIDHQLEIYAGLRNVHEGSIKLANNKVSICYFDFNDPATYHKALEGCDILFLVRPPQLSDVKKIFKPIVDACKDKAVKHIIFLSVQGVEKSSIIPHHKIEKLIVDSGIPYTFLRPAYFMQNFTTTLHADLVARKRIYLPAGDAKFTLIDVRDIAAVAATILANVSQHVNKAYDLTNKEKFTFSQMAIILSDHLGTHIRYQSPTLLGFFVTKRKEKLPAMLILVMIMLHYFPRFQPEPETTDCVDIILKRQPITFEQFVRDHKKLLTT